jgi:hypothetical protein
VQPPKERVIFEVAEKAKADLKIALHRDGLTQTMFFNAVVAAYNEHDENFLAWFEIARGKITKNKSRQKMLGREEATAAQNMKKFGFNKDELEDIFDIIAEERGEQL